MHIWIIESQDEITLKWCVSNNVFYSRQEARESVRETKQHFPDLKLRVRKYISEDAVPDLWSYREY